MGWIKFKNVFYVFLLCLSAQAATAQTADYSIYANIVYRFTKYIDWPDNKKSGDFIIGVVGESRIYDELISFTKGKRVGDQPIVIKRLSPEAKSYNCHILFISEDESGSVKRISAATAGKPLLIISENTGLIWKGACINILIVSDHLKLEFSKSNIENRNLNIASELLSLGTVVN